jgi:tripartite-type tricarboxylate transporter receptor subunit TctC
MFHRIAAIGLASALVLFLTVTSSNQAAAGEIEDFYSGKTITIYIGYGFGGTYGKYSRTMAKHLTKHIPGHPKLIVKSMPGAGGIKMTNFAYNAMPKNGYHFLVPPDASVVSQLLRPKKVRYKAQDFTWIGATNQTNTIFVLRKDTGVKKWQDLRTIPVISGNTGPGSTSFLIPAMMNSMLGTKIKQIAGYKGSSKTILAMEQGEHHGTAFNWLAWSSKVPQWFEKKTEFALPVLQTGVFRDPDLPNVPMLKDVVAKKHVPIVSFMATLGIIGRGIALPNGAPKKLVKPLRMAFANMVKDPAYIADAKKARLRVIYTSGEDIQKFVNDAVANASPEVVGAARKLIFGK